MQFNIVVLVEKKGGGQTFVSDEQANKQPVGGLFDFDTNIYTPNKFPRVKQTSPDKKHSFYMFL